MFKLDARNFLLTLCASVGLLHVVSARAQCDSGSTGADGAFSPTQSPTVIDLATDGTYDPDRWAVVFNFTTIDVPSNVVILFRNHPSGAPVVWLAQGDVTIAGQINLDGSGSTGQTWAPAQPGPGGFEGGVRGTGIRGSASGGFGPGGAPVVYGNRFCGAGGGYATYGNSSSCGGQGLPGGLPYGSQSIVPLIGGSGGSASWQDAGGGGAGGGAILIAAGTSSNAATINITGFITARGGAGGDGGSGSGGSIRLSADRVTGQASNLLATGGGGGSSITGAPGRIRIDANDLSALLGHSVPEYSTDLLCTVPFPQGLPKLTLVRVDMQSVTPDPRAGITTTDVEIFNSGPVQLDIEAQNIPPGTIVLARIVPVRGEPLGCAAPAMTCSSTPLIGTLERSVANVVITFLPGRSEVQLRANW